MKNQSELILKMSELAGGQNKLAFLINKPSPRISEWIKGTHAMSLNTFLEMCEKLNVKTLNL